MILTGYWLAWALYPVPGPGFDYQAVGVPADWPHHYSGFAAHWNKNANLGNAFDQWFLNLFPRDQAVRGQRRRLPDAQLHPDARHHDPGADRRAAGCAPPRPASRSKRLLVAGAVGVAAGLAAALRRHLPGREAHLDARPGRCSAAALCFLLLAAFCWVIEVKGWRKWAFPLVVIGMNSIAAYMIAHLFQPLHRGLLPHPPGAQCFFHIFGERLEPLLHGRGGAAGLLADPVLDVPAQALPAHLSGHNVVPGCAAATPTEEP